MAISGSRPSPLPAAVNRTGQVAAFLAEEIRTNKVRPGQRLPTEQALAARFHVSRTVVREAIASLRAEGLVVTRQGAGAFVAQGAALRPFRIIPDELGSVAEVLHVMELRLAVEVEAAALAAERRDARALSDIDRALDAIDAAARAGRAAVEEDFAFHVAIAAATGNPYFERFLHFLGTIIIPRHTLSAGIDDATTLRAYLNELQVEHRAIFIAIRDADSEGARRAARTHLTRARERYQGLMQAPPNHP